VAGGGTNPWAKPSCDIFPRGDIPKNRCPRRDSNPDQHKASQDGTTKPSPQTLINAITGVSSHSQVKANVSEYQPSAENAVYLLIEAVQMSYSSLPLSMIGWLIYSNLTSVIRRDKHNKNINNQQNKTLDKRNPASPTVSCAPSGDRGMRAPLFTSKQENTNQNQNNLSTRR
jgi:hypothetical protein